MCVCVCVCGCIFVSLRVCMRMCVCVRVWLSLYVCVCAQKHELLVQQSYQNAVFFCKYKAVFDPIFTDLLTSSKVKVTLLIFSLIIQLTTRLALNLISG